MQTETKVRPARIVSFEPLIQVVARIGRDSQGIELGGYHTFCSPLGDEVRVQWRGRVVLTIGDFAQRKRLDRADGVETTYSARFSTYVGWKLYERICLGCFASKPKYEDALELGEDTPLADCD